jgi:hypothetical protein
MNTLNSAGLSSMVARVVWVLALLGSARVTVASSLTAAYLARTAAFGQPTGCARC